MSETENEEDNRRESQIEKERRKKELGLGGYYLSKGVSSTSSAFVTLIYNIVKVKFKNGEKNQQKKKHFFFRIQK